MNNDPRPLTGEPLALDLVNTEWIGDGDRRDLLTDVAGLRVWLAANGLDAPAATDAEATLEHLRTARAAIRATLERPAAARARETVNTILARGHVISRLDSDGRPADAVVVADPAWRPAHLAARDLLALLRDHPARLRACAGPDCILHFLDTSRSGRRQWCSMSACGNRAKARRHYARARVTPGPG